jgi:hypothetical protein
MNARKGAINDGKLDPKPATTAIDSSLVKVEEAASDYDTKLTQDTLALKDTDKYLSALKHLKTGLAGYQPQTKPDEKKKDKEKPGRHEEMARYVWALTELVDERIATVSERRAGLLAEDKAKAQPQVQKTGSQNK